MDLTPINYIIYILISLGNSVLLCLLGYKFFHILQLSDYKLIGFVEWVKDTKARYFGRVISLSFLSFICAIVTNACFITYSYYVAFIGLIPYIILTIIFRINVINAKMKTPLKSTHRLARLVGVLFVLSFFVSFGLIMLSRILPDILFICILTLSPLLLVLLVLFAHIILMPYERLVEIRFMKRAKKKLAKYPYLIKIGITGSYGKTTTKYILNSILSKKYNVCMSPHSFNTSMGLCKVVDKYLEPYHEVMIAEMGASETGDINYLCKFIKPSMGIITGISNQHLRTFFSMNNIKNTKYELVKNVEKQDNAFMVFNGTNEIVEEFYTKCKCDKNIIGTKKDCDIVFSNVKLSLTGTTFDITYNKNTYTVKTNLIGQGVVQDICMAMCIALRLEMQIEDIIDAIKDIKQISHRLEVKNENDYTILDDSYNSNTFGYKQALEMLSIAKGKKIIVTPGLVELGRAENDCNKTLGNDISKICDVCIIVNESNYNAIEQGIKENTNSKTQIIKAVNLDDAKIKLSSIIEKDSCILFENDLPDNYL